jgi:hypothetical protein
MPRVHTLRLNQRACAERQLLWFQILSPAEQAACIRLLAAQGSRDHAIASFTKLDVDDVRRILSLSA